MYKGIMGKLLGRLLGTISKEKVSNIGTGNNAAVCPFACKEWLFAISDLCVPCVQEGLDAGLGATSRCGSHGGILSLQGVVGQLVVPRNEQIWTY